MSKQALQILLFRLSGVYTGIRAYLPNGGASGFDAYTDCQFIGLELVKIDSQSKQDNVTLIANNLDG